VSALGFPQAAGITGILTAAGLRSAEVHAWFRQPRRELGELAPADLVELRETVPSAGRLLLELAKADARRIRGVMDLEREDLERAELDRLQHAADLRDEERIEREAEESDRRRSNMAAEPVRYAGLIYHAVRDAGYNPLVAGWRALRILRREAWCMAIGHEWTWIRAAEIGASRRVCDRCLRAEPRKADRHA
jgi:hypothetical protein